MTKIKNPIAYNKKEEETVNMKAELNQNNVFLLFLEKLFRKKSSNFYTLIIFVNLISLLIKFSIGIYGYSGKNKK